MNVNDTVRELRRKEKEIRKAFSRTLPRRIGAKAVNLVNRNFREGGFYDGGAASLEENKETGFRQGAAGAYGPPAKPTQPPVPKFGVCGGALQR